PSILSLHDALPIFAVTLDRGPEQPCGLGAETTAHLARSLHQLGQVGDEALPGVGILDDGAHRDLAQRTAGVRRPSGEPGLLDLGEDLAHDERGTAHCDPPSDVIASWSWPGRPSG